MNLVQLLHKASLVDLFKSHNSVIFQYKQDYPLLFFSRIFEYLRQQSLLLAPLDLAQEDDGAIISKLTTSFLGEKMIYCLHRFDTLDDRKQKMWLGLIEEYNGPHCILISINGLAKKTHDAQLIINVDETIDQRLFITLLPIFAPELVSKRELIAAIFRSTAMIPLDQACLLMHYMKVIGNNTGYFLDQWLHKIIIPEKSLFSLSTYFFAKKAKLFLDQWRLLSEHYNEQFWIAYWSEQLWRAHYFIEFMEAHKMVQAKKISSRLPFTFIQRDWKLYKGEELKNAHEFVYRLDSSLKNGGSPLALDLFYSKFFLGQFK